MITFISLLLTSLYIFLMTYFVSSVWYFILIWAITGIIVFYLSTGLFFVFFSILIMPLLKDDSKFKYFLLRSFARWLMVFLFWGRVKVIGRENVPADGKLIIYANHKSKFDPGFVTQAIHRPHGYAVKSDLKEYPITKQIVESMRSFYIFREDNRKTLKSLLYGIKMAEQGFAYVIFPEGGTMYRDQDKITEVRPGSFKIAERAQTDILPVSIIGSNFRKRKRCIFKPTLVTVVIHEVIPYEEIKDLTTNEISDKVIEVINSVL